MRNTRDNTVLELGKYDENELIEMVDNDIYGASSPTIIASIGLSVAIATATQVCPTGVCTDSC